MKTSDAGINLIQQFEGEKLTAYKDIVGIWTIGFGHTGPEVCEGQKISHDEAIALLHEDLRRFEECVEAYADVELDQNEFDALVAFAYNVGCNALKSSTLMLLLNSGKKDAAAEQFLRWDKAGGLIVAGLLRRREAERELFLA